MRIWIERLLRLATATLLIGRGWQFIAADASYREILYRHKYMLWIVRAFTDMSWDQYASNQNINMFYSQVVDVLGVGLIATGIACIFYRGRSGVFSKALIAASVALWLLAFADAVEYFSRWGHFVEHALMASTPFLLREYLYNERREARMWMFCRVAIALTFIGHGLYAVGYYPVPGRFLDLCMSLLHINQSQAAGLLKVMGILDFIVAAAVLVPKFTTRPVLFYLVIWGLATAVARIAMTSSIEYFWPTFWQWAPDTLYRLVHGLVPLALTLHLFPLPITAAQDREIIAN